MPYLLHNKCRSPVYLDATPGIKLITAYGFGKNSLKAGTGDIIISEESFKTIFYCLSCTENMEAAQLSSNCYMCGKFFEVKDLVIGVESNTLACQECAKLFFTEKSKELLPILIRATIK